MIQLTPRYEAIFATENFDYHYDRSLPPVIIKRIQLSRK